MPEYTQTDNAIRVIPSVKVEGYTVHQPIEKAERKLQEFRERQRVVLEKISKADKNDMELLAEHGAELTQAQNGITQWGVPLHVHAPYIYPPSIFSADS
ncbi:MAG: hypothetical protein ABWX90_00775 [Candidatus Saccharimonadales bacterium]